MITFLRYSSFLLCLILNEYKAVANAGIWRGSLDINLNGTTTNYREGSGTGTPFNGANLGSITNSSTFQLKDPYLFSFKNSGCDVTGANFYYRVYKSGATPGVYNSLSFVYACNCFNGCWRNSISGCGTDDQEWGSSSSIIDLLQAAKTANGSAGTYVLDVYWTINVASCSIPPALGAFTATFTATTTLPIELTAFQAEKTDRSVALRWTTATEQNNDHFELEHAADGNKWSLLSIIPTQNGNARSPQTYASLDQHPWPARNYYRLRQVDKDGNFTYSPVRMVEMGRTTTAIIFPNPVINDALQLVLPPSETNARVRLTDVQGRVLRNWTLNTETEWSGTLDLSGVPTGVFFVQVNGDLPLRIVKQ